MPSLRYYNQAGPFWDFIADLEAQGSSHPLFDQINQARGDRHQPGQSFPWGWPFGNRSRPHPPFDFTGETPAPEAPDSQADPSADIDNPPSPNGPAADQEMPPRSRSASPSAGHGERLHGERAHGHQGHRGRHGRNGCNGRGRGGFGPRDGRRGWGRQGGFGPGGPFNLNALAALFNDQLGGGDRDPATGVGGQGQSEDFKPQVDVFDAEAAYVLHVSLPGAKKEDVGVSWDAEKSELSVTGVVHRPGDEDFLKTLALDERQVGAFERKVRLGSRANPAQVDGDAISARLDAGILTIQVPKEDKDYVDVKKVDIE